LHSGTTSLRQEGAHAQVISEPDSYKRLSLGEPEQPVAVIAEQAAYAPDAGLSQPVPIAGMIMIHAQAIYHPDNAVPVDTPSLGLRLQAERALVSLPLRQPGVLLCSNAVLPHEVRRPGSKTLRPWIFRYSLLGLDIPAGFTGRLMTGQPGLTERRELGPGFEDLTPRALPALLGDPAPRRPIPPTGLDMQLPANNVAYQGLRDAEPSSKLVLVDTTSQPELPDFSDLSI
jgi:hypothetical protein